MGGKCLLMARIMCLRIALGVSARCVRHCLGLDKLALNIIHNFRSLLRSGRHISEHASQTL